MVEKKGIIGIIYDNNGGQLYFLLVHKNLPDSKAWEFVKGHVIGEMNTEEAMRQEIKETVGLKKYTIKKKLDFNFHVSDGQDTIVNDVYLVDTSMNIPVKLDYDPNKLNTYLWCNKKRTMETISPSHKDLLERAMAELGKMTE
ncbi:MAG: NUDIX hydrolase [Nanoarchaeota archaeon]